MQLTEEQERLAAEGNDAERQAMRILLALGTIYDADRLLPVVSAHVSGASLRTVGEPGMEFIEDFAKTARVRVRTTINPVGMDLERWRVHGIPEDFAAKQLRIVRAYESMGAEPSYTCTPYLAGNRPTFGETLAWAESSAVAFVNSVIGARSNREGGPSALAAAVTGWTPRYGCHTDQGRRATVLLRVEAPVRGLDFSLLGLHVGKAVGDGIPYFTGLSGNEDDWKWLSAALAAAGSVPMFHVEGVTPEWREAVAGALPSLAVSAEDLSAVKRAMTTGDEPDLLGFGTPQLSVGELRQLADLVDEIRPKKRFWVCTSRFVRALAKDAVERLEHRGGIVLADTCLEVTPLDLFAKTTGTPSGKAAVYLPSLCKQKVIVADPEELLRWGT